MYENPILMDSTFQSGDCSYLLGFSVVSVLLSLFLVLFVKLLQSMWFGNIYVWKEQQNVCAHATIGRKEIFWGWIFYVCKVVYERGVTMGKDTLEIFFLKPLVFLPSENHQFFEDLWIFFKKIELEVFWISKFLKLKTIDYQKN